MARRTVSIRDLRAQVEAADRLGVPTNKPHKPRADRAEPKPKADASRRMKLVWTVCDIGGRAVQSFDYADKAQAEAFAAARQAKTRDNHFVRSEKVPM